MCVDGSEHFAYMVPRSNGLTSSVIPMASRFCWISAACFGYGSASSVMARTSLHSGASHNPSPSVSYADAFMASIAFVTSPCPLGVAYGS